MHQNANSRRRLTRSDRQGFSLIEMLITVLVFAILAAAVLPLFGTHIPTQLTSVAQIVAADLDDARALAIANGSNYRLTVDVTNNQYWLAHVGSNTLLNVLPPSSFKLSSDTSNRRTTALNELPISTPKVRLVGAEATAGSGSAVTNIEFNSLGGTIIPQDTVFWLACGSGTAGRYISVQVSAITGLAEIGDVQAVVPALAAAGS